jgi:hypothetical protein
LETLIIWREQSNGTWAWEAPALAGGKVGKCSAGYLFFFHSGQYTRKHSSNVAEVMVGLNTVVLLLVLLVLVDSFLLYLDKDEAVAVMLLWWSFSYQPPQW